MKQPTVTSFFLGANSESGFYSLYDQFCTAPYDYLHIIKGGPGTGKSTFMRRIGKAAEERGFDVEYILCSGDPDSLDGVYIPKLRVGWVDGTAPHIIEPNLFGASADYINLGQFCNTVPLKECHPQIQETNARYKTHYQNAYNYLHAAGTVYRQNAINLSYDREQKLRKRARSKIMRELDKHNTKGTPIKRFLRAFSCQGNYISSQTINALCHRLCILESHFGLEELFLREILSVIQSHGANCIICPSPLCPDLIDSVILPEEKLCFVSSNAVPAFDGIIRTIHLDSFLQEADRKEAKKRAALYNAILDAAFTELKKAKHLHDALESYYSPYLDTKALNEYTEATIHTLFP